MSRVLTAPGPERLEAGRRRGVAAAGAGGAGAGVAGASSRRTRERARAGEVVIAAAYYRGGAGPGASVCPGPTIACTNFL